MVDTTIVFVKGQRLKFEGFAKTTSGFACSVAGILGSFDIPMRDVRIVLTPYVSSIPSSTQAETSKTKSPNPTTEKTESPQPTTEKTSPKEDSGGGQCTATTKKGTRCTRRATSGGTCWQH
jgi:cytoskeletal protein RodZ